MGLFGVRATMHGGRITTTKSFKKRTKAEAYASETNKYRPGANARVVRK